jgi:hypothetical protein
MFQTFKAGSPRGRRLFFYLYVTAFARLRSFRHRQTEKGAAPEGDAFRMP